MKIIKLKTVLEMTSLSRSTIYDYMSRDLFPKQVKIGENSVGWVLSEVEDWINNRISERDTKLDSYQNLN
ncbi:helix-turn-helix transcriptional regulator [Francisella philomiragia]|uniref:helix-turn-helix transcriptional regulator n=1 Tax=Francisella philomiragia TaxID=28110 RepID=UPI001904BD0F|nr:AlpA family transcriptional regulator [Francisella philomiragia]MBK2256666.1 AlpA family transcriptional regulator [Francisella philomiragia]MBK2269324.1 AlpA family transcriptional regulator [Francisella philomiragia]MBK2271311.1 AlpA family transcriptional regulator [Francisella philomiragia]MBK2275091.1 AlpA family transcriptional regulator [Francisella philomiragia]MBK2294685.1 AlpA family transcriptional regulator [Francisella philomiragia]